MTRIARDSTVAADIPIRAASGELEMVMGYANGGYRWPDTSWRLFAGLPWVRIDVTGDYPAADMLDVETGDAAPAQAPGWIRSRHALKPAYPPVVYVNRDNMPLVVSACTGAGLTLARDYMLGVATLDGAKTVPDMTGVMGVQFMGEQLTGGHYDEWVIYDDGFCPPRYGTLIIQGDPAGRAYAMISRDRAHTVWRPR